MRKTAAGKIKNTDWMKERKIPVRVLKSSGNYCENLPVKNGFVFSALKKSLVFGLIVLATASQSALFSAFEAHVINVTATIEDGIAEYIVVNEVYYNVGNRKFCAIDKESEPRNEWIELYNPTDAPVDVSGWIIEDNNSSDVIPASPSVPAHGFAVISKDDSTWLFWNIPSEAVKITLGSVIGNGLSNDGDRVILKDASGVEIDAVSYGDDTYAFIPSVPSVSEGHSIARSPKGFDTNKFSDWVELEVPNPGTNPHYKEHTDGTPCFGGSGSGADTSETGKGNGEAEQPIVGDTGDNGNDGGIENENSGENSAGSANEDLNKEQEKPENGEEGEIEENNETALDETTPDETTSDEVILEETAPDEIISDEAVLDETVSGEIMPGEAVQDEVIQDETASDETISNETKDNISEESSASEESPEELAETVSSEELESDGGE